MASESLRMYSSSGFGNAGDNGRAIPWFARIARNVTVEIHDQERLTGIAGTVVVCLPT